MIRVHVFAEGQTEETFVRELLFGYFVEQDIFVNPILVRTSRTGKGGLLRYAKIKPQLHRKCLEDQTSFVTTLFDLYHLPKDFPGQTNRPSTVDPLRVATHLERELGNDLGHANFLPNFVVHEFEGLLYSRTECFGDWFDRNVIPKLTSERSQFQTPEHINDGELTAPSKRILRHCPNYEKPLHGSLIAMDIGLDTIRRKCKHFDEWMTRISSLRTGNHT